MHSFRTWTAAGVLAVAMSAPTALQAADRRILDNDVRDISAMRMNILVGDEQCGGLYTLLRTWAKEHAEFRRLPIVSDSARFDASLRFSATCTSDAAVIILELHRFDLRDLHGNVVLAVAWSNHFLFQGPAPLESNIYAKQGTQSLIDQFAAHYFAAQMPSRQRP